jgi:uncharacterized protein (TIGR03435 family)
MNELMAVLIAVLNSLWQAALLAAVASIAIRFAPRMNAATRFAIWWTVLVVVLILPLAPGVISSARGWFAPETIPSARARYAPPPKPAQMIEAPPLVTVAQPSAARWPLWIAAIWGLLLGCRLSRLTRSYLQLRGLKRRATVSDEPLPHASRGALVLLSPEVDSPIAVGFIRPAVILPETLPARLSRAALDHVLLHEAAHLARCDDWSNLVSRVLAAVLTPHPVALWILHRIEIEREAACDDWVVAGTRSARPYAETLVRLHELRSAQWSAQELLAPGIFGGGSVVARVEKLLRKGRDFTSRVSGARVGAGVALLVGLALIASVFPKWIVLAQSPRPAFEVASIKRHTELSNRFVFAARPGGRLAVVNSSIADAINNAYGILEYQLIGAPDWVNSDHYDIEARGAASAGEKEVMLMLQSLFADRFAMKAHLETREMPAYILTVAKGGPKMVFLGSEDCVRFDSTKPNNRAVPNVCGNNFVHANSWNATHISMWGVVRIMSVVLRRPVIDKTGVKGTFDVRMQWSDDLAPADNAADAPPSLESALRETLGLDLKSGRGAAEVLVLDHIERPREN